MASNRIILAALTAPMLVACATLEPERNGEDPLAEFRTSCLSARRPAYSPEHTDCVIARYKERQAQFERLRHALAPPPPAWPEVGPQPGPINPWSPMYEPENKPWLI